MFEVEKQSTFVTDYDAKNDVLYIHLQGGNPNSYSIGNPAHIDGVEWLVASADPQHITGAIILDWHRRWMDHHMMPPLPFALSWPGTALPIVVLDSDDLDREHQPMSASHHNRPIFE